MQRIIIYINNIIIDNILTQSLERKMREVGVSLDSLTTERRQLQDENQELIKQRAQMEFSVKDLQQNVEDDEINKVC